MNLKEVYRDIESFGSHTFYAAAIIRSLVGFNWTFFTELLGTFLAINIVIYFANHFFRHKISTHAANATALFVLVNAFYKSNEFFVFSAFLLLTICYGHTCIRHHLKTEIFSGLIVGISISLFALFFSV